VTSRILAIETSSAACSVALQVGDSVHVREEILPRRHQERLPMLIQDLFGASGANASSLDAIAFGRGPGSFTGLRLAAATAQAWGMAANVPVYPVSSLAALALAAAWKQGASVHIGALIKARAGEIYVGEFAWTGHTLQATAIERRVQASRVTFDVVPDLAVGDGCLEVTSAAISTDASVLPGAEAVLALVPTVTACEAAHALPVYLQADADWSTNPR